MGPKGAAVDVSLVCFGRNGGTPFNLAGQVVDRINPDLTSGHNLTIARPLSENRKGAFLRLKSGPFDVGGSVARRWVSEALNPNGRGNSEVLRPYWNGDDVTGRPRDVWFVDLPLRLSELDAALYVSPFRHIATTQDDDGKTVQELRAALGEQARPKVVGTPLAPPRDALSDRKRIAIYRYAGIRTASCFRLAVVSRPAG